MFYLLGYAIMNLGAWAVVIAVEKDGQAFQAFAVTFPTGGCWEIIQQVAGRELRFVVWVRT